MTHAEIENELPFYLNGTATPRVRAAVERELATCERCNAASDELRALRAGLLELDAALGAPSAHALSDVLAQISRDEAEPIPPVDGSRKGILPRWMTPRLQIAGGGLALALLAGFLVLARLPFAAPNVPESPVNESVQVAPPSVASRAAESAGPLPATPPPNLAPVPKLKLNVPIQTSRGTSREAASARVRQLARTGTIGLLVPDISAAIARCERIAAVNVGLVVDLQDDAPSTPDELHTAQLTLSVPDDRFTATLAALGAVGGVTSRSVRTEDLTDSIVDAAARLRNLRREETDLLRIMDRSGKVSDILSVEDQLADTRRQIEELDAQAAAMRGRVAYATISVEFAEERTVTTATPAPAAQLSNAWRAAQGSVWAFTLGVVARLFLLVVFAPYVAAAVAGIFLAVVAIRRVRARSDR